MDVTPGKIARAFPVHPLPHHLLYRGDDILCEIADFDLVVALTSNVWPRRNIDAIQAMIGRGDRLPRLHIVPWPEVEEEQIQCLFGEFPLLSGEAQHYYLPALLSLALKASPEATSPHVVSFIATSWSKGDRGDGATRMSREQWAVFRHCVRRLRHRFPILFRDVDLTHLDSEPMS